MRVDFPPRASVKSMDLRGVWTVQKRIQKIKLVISDPGKWPPQWRQINPDAQLLSPTQSAGAHCSIIGPAASDSECHKPRSKSASLCLRSGRLGVWVWQRNWQYGIFQQLRTIEQAHGVFGLSSPSAAQIDFAASSAAWGDMVGVVLAKISARKKGKCSISLTMPHKALPFTELD